MKIVILGLSITSSWGNGHATTYRALVRALAARGHDILFLERDAPWYAGNRDLPEPPYCRTALYEELPAAEARYGGEIAAADLVIVGSYVPDGIAVGDMVHRLARGLTAFYDIDTPVTLARLETGGTDYLLPAQIARYDSTCHSPVARRSNASSRPTRPGWRVLSIARWIPTCTHRQKRLTGGVSTWATSAPTAPIASPFSSG